jgi:predicted amidophosphoribosyltransferase
MSLLLLRSQHPSLCPILDVIYPPVCSCCKRNIPSEETPFPKCRKGSFLENLACMKIYLQKKLFCSDCLISLKEEEIRYEKNSHCACCGRFAITTNISPLCIACSDKRPYPNLRIRSLYYYLPTSRQLIHQIKYKEKIEVANLVLLDLITSLPKMFLPGSRYFHSNNQGSGLTWNFISFVPSTQKNIKRRGFYSTYYITRKISHLLKIPFIELVLDARKHSDTPRSWLPRHRRNEEIPEFTLRKVIKRLAVPSNPRILLIDDVITTGGSIIGAIEALQQITPGSIDVISISQSKHLHRYLLK